MLPTRLKATTNQSKSKKTDFTMSFHLHILNMRNGATNQDIRSLFSGMSIDADGVTVIGGTQGEAFVTFGDQKELLRAMQMDGMQNLKFKIATDLEKLNAINKMCMTKLQTMGYTPTVTPWKVSLPTSSGENGNNLPPDIIKSRDKQFDNSSYNSQPLKRSFDDMDIDTDSDSSDTYDMKRSRIDEDKRMMYRQVDISYYGHKDYRENTARDLGVEPRKAPDLQSTMHDEKILSPPHTPFLHGIASHVLEQTWDEGPDPVHPQSSNHFRGSLFNTLLSKGRYGPTHCSILIFDLPADITASRVYELLVGGPRGKSLGVVLLKPSNDQPVAFAMYRTETEREEAISQSTNKMEPYSYRGTCRFVTKFIQNWMRWKGPRKLACPISETTKAGQERCVSFSEIKPLAETVSDVKPVNPFVRTTGVPSPHADTSGDPRQFLVIFQMMPTATASEVLSWFTEGVSAIKLDFVNEHGPRNSEAMAFIMFPNKMVYKNAENELAGKGLNIERYKISAGYQLIARLGDHCTITQTTSGGDRIVQPAERQRPPFQPTRRHQYTLMDVSNMWYLQLKAFKMPCNANQIYSWFSEAEGVIAVSSPDGCPEFALVAFRHANDRNKELATIIEQKDRGKSMPWVIQRLKTATEAFSILANESEAPIDQLKLSTPSNRHDRDLTDEETTFLMKYSDKDNAHRKEHLPSSVSGVKSLRKSASFMEHLKTPAGTPSEPLYLAIYSLEQKQTACEVLSWFSGAVCSAKVNFNQTELHSPEAMAYILFKSKEERDNAKLEYNRWLNHGHAYGKNKGTFISLHRDSLEIKLSQVCHRCTISESSSSGVDRVLTMDQFLRIPTNEPFRLTQDSHYHYAQIIDFDHDMTASELWTRFGEQKGLIRGILLSVKTKNESPNAYLACESIKDRQELLSIKKRKTHTLAPVSQRQVYDFLKSCTSTIKMSTETGQDRSLEQDEKKVLRCKVDSTITVKEPAKQNPTKWAKNPTTNKKMMSKDGTHLFYIRLRKVPAKVNTACELLSLYTNDDCPGKSATLVHDSEGTAVSGYVLFEDLAHRDSALSKSQFSLRCTANGRAVRLREYDCSHEIMESTPHGEDRLMTVADIAALDQQFNPEAVERKSESPKTTMRRMLGDDKNIYYRFVNLPTKLTASKLWSVFNGLKGPSTYVLMVRDAERNIMFAYVTFSKSPASFLQRFEEHDYSLSSFEARNHELAYLEATAEITEASDAGNDLVVNSESRHLFLNAFENTGKVAETMSEGYCAPDAEVNEITTNNEVTFTKDTNQQDCAATESITTTGSEARMLLKRNNDANLETEKDKNNVTS